MTKPESVEEPRKKTGRPLCVHERENQDYFCRCADEMFELGRASMKSDIEAVVPGEKKKTGFMNVLFHNGRRERIGPVENNYDAGHNDCRAQLLANMEGVE